MADKLRRDGFASFVWCLIGLCLLVAPMRGQGGGAKETEAGFQALQAGNADRAASLFYTAVTNNPQDPAAHFGAGVAAHLLGREDRAKVSLKRALELEPRLSQAAELLGVITYQEGDIDAAIRIYEQSFTHAPGSEAMHARVAGWKKEATVHQTLTERNDGRFTLVFDGQADEALASHTAATLEAAYWRIGRELGRYPSDRIQVTLYTDQQFRDITNVPAWAGGAFDGKLRIPVGGAAQNLPQLDRVLAHELTHAMVYSVAPRNIPAWLHEGLASHFEPRDPEIARRQILLWGAFVPLHQLPDRFLGLNAEQAAIAYAESVVAGDVLMHWVGTRVTDVLQEMGRGLTFEQSLEQIGVRVEDFDAELTRRFKG